MTDKEILAFLDHPVARNHIAQTMASAVSGGFNFLDLADAAVRAVREVADLIGVEDKPDLVWQPPTGVGTDPARRRGH